MTLKELSQLYYLTREIETDRERLARIRSQVMSYGTPDLSGMPKAHNGDNRLERLIAEIIDLETIIAAKELQCVHEKSRLERYIRDIPDSLTRQIFTLRFSEGKSWEKAADAIGGGNTDVGIRQRVYRYLKSEKDVTKC
jgi:hypothetical protein